MSVSNPIPSGIYHHRYSGQSEFVKGTVMYPDVCLKVLNDRVTGAETSDLWQLVKSGRCQEVGAVVVAFCVCPDSLPASLGLEAVACAVVITDITKTVVIPIKLPRYFFVFIGLSYKLFLLI